MTRLEACYTLLNLRKTATPAVMRDVYRKLVPPDRATESNWFQEINGTDTALREYYPLMDKIPQPEDVQTMPKAMAGDRL